MKRRELLKICKALSLTVEDGSKHLKVRDRHGTMVAVVSKGTGGNKSRGYKEQNLRARLKRAAINAGLEPSNEG